MAEPKKRLLSNRLILVLMAGILLVVVVVQFLYPSDQALPRATLNTIQVGGKSSEEIAALLQDEFEEIEVKIAAGDLEKTVPLTNLGATVDVNKSVEQIVKYRWWERLVPFSLIWIEPKTEVFVDYDEANLEQLSTELVSDMKIEPENAKVELSDTGEVVIAAAKNGSSVGPERLVKSLKSKISYTGDATIEVESDIVPPSVTNQMAEQVKIKIAEGLDKKLVIGNSLDSSVAMTPDRATMASWIVIGNDLSLTIDEARVAPYLNQIARPQLIQPGTTTVKTVDGAVAGRVDAPWGRGVNLARAASELTSALFENGRTTITLQFLGVAPTIVYSHTYSNSEAGLRAYVDEVTKNGNIQVAVQQLSGSGWSAAGGETKSVVSASTYKLYISALLFDKINSGEIKWSDLMLGTNVDGCLRNMIVLSANNCPEQWINQWGRQNINRTLAAKGFSPATTFVHPDAAHTSAGDLIKFMTGLDNRTLLKSTDSDKLIGLMKEQVYRRGIPAGSDGEVANKVGFLWDYLNDAAIVYHPKGKYALVVMTKGESWAKIAEITHQIEAIMYP